MNSTTRPTAVVAEDEPILRAQLTNMLGAVWPELDIVAAAEDGMQAMRALEQHSPDVLFIDILMPGLTGLEVAPGERTLPCRVRDRLRPVCGGGL